MSEHDDDLYLSAFVENLRMLDLESPIKTERRELLGLSSVGNLSADSDADQLKNWLLKAS